MGKNSEKNFHKGAENLVRKINALEKQIIELQDDYNTSKIKLQKYFDKYNVDELIVDIVDNDLSKNSTSLVAKKIERVYVDYDTKQLKKNLDKELFNEVTIKDYKINNMHGLVKLLKKAGIKPKEFKSFVDVSIKPNKAKIKQLFSVGDITKKDLENCVNSKIVKFVQIKEVSNK